MRNNRINNLTFLTHTDPTCAKCGETFPHMVGPWDEPTHCPSCTIELQEAAEQREEAEREEAAQAKIQAECDASLAQAVAYGKVFDNMLRSIFPTI